MATKQHKKNKHKIAILVSAISVGFVAIVIGIISITINITTHHQYSRQECDLVDSMYLLTYAGYSEVSNSRALDESKWASSVLRVLDTNISEHKKTTEIKGQLVTTLLEEFVDPKDGTKSFDGDKLSAWTLKKMVEVGNTCRNNGYPNAITYIPEEYTPDDWKVDRKLSPDIYSAVLWADEDY